MPHDVSSLLSAAFCRQYYPAGGILKTQNSYDLSPYIYIYTLRFRLDNRGLTRRDGSKTCKISARKFNFREFYFDVTVPSACRLSVTPSIYMLSVGVDNYGFTFSAMYEVI